VSDGPAAGLTPEEIRRRRGYEPDFHRIMTAADPEWVRQCGVQAWAAETGFAPAEGGGTS
jgi:hypothetical protein